MAQPTPTIRIATRADLPAITEFLNIVFPAKVRTIEEVTAKYTPPDGWDNVPPGYLAEVGETIVGFYGVMSWVVTRGERLVATIQPCDVAVALAYRKTGLYLKLYNAYRMRRDVFAPVAFGFPDGKAATIGIAKMGYVMRSATVVMEFKGPPVIDYSAQVQAEVWTHVPAHWFPYVAAFASRLGTTTLRTQAFYEWRFQDTADAKHVFLSATKAGVLVGIAVLRYNPKAGLDSPVLIFDLFADDDETRQTLLHLAGMEVIPTAGHPLYHGCTTNAPYLAHLEQLGFTAVTNGVLVTSVLENATATPLDPDYEALHTTDSWFCTFTDTDR